MDARREDDSQRKRGAVPVPGPAVLCDLPNSAAAKAAYIKTALASGLSSAAVGQLGPAVGDAIQIHTTNLGRLHPALRTPGQQAAWDAHPASYSRTEEWPTPSKDELRSFELMGL